MPTLPGKIVHDRPWIFLWGCRVEEGKGGAGWARRKEGRRSGSARLDFCRSQSKRGGNPMYAERWETNVQNVSRQPKQGINKNTEQIDVLRHAWVTHGSTGVGETDVGRPGLWCTPNGIYPQTTEKSKSKQDVYVCTALVKCEYIARLLAAFNRSTAKKPIF